MKENIVFKDINFSFGEFTVLRNLNFTIKKGSIHSLVGISGVGKSTALRILANLNKPQSGEVINRPEHVSFAFQRSPLFPWLTVLENLSICTKSPLELNSFLKLFRLDEILHSYPRDLSGGMVQKINILRSFLDNPELILMDEPFVHIDSIQKEELHQFLLILWNKFRPTIVYVTHDIDEALLLSHEISLFSLKNKGVIETFEVVDCFNSTVLELKNNSNYAGYFQKIYEHLKQDLI
jgi:ABC-type nitrate/sulfonate/bicarbonate transport system ATPase subunit